MGEQSAIEWTDATWNPVTGCSKVSPGCEHCYAELLSTRFGRTTKPWTFPNAAENVVLHPDRLDLPLRWKSPRRVFVNSMSDLFHENVPDEFLASVLKVMGQARGHTFQVLTKRPERMQHMLSTLATNSEILHVPFWPLPNVWLGVSCEDQRRADERIPFLLETPAAVRFLSCEPLLGPIDLHLVTPSDWRTNCDPHDRPDWVITGGESAGPLERRLVHKLNGITDVYAGRDTSIWVPSPQGLEWIRAIRDQCQAAGVPFFFKQWGGPHPHSAGRLLDGREWNEFPTPQGAPA